MSPADERPTSAGGPAPTTPRRRRLWRTVLVAVSGAGVLGLVAAVTLAGTIRPPLAPREVPPVVVDVPAPSTDLLCPGTLRLATETEPGADVGYDPQFDPSPVEATVGLGLVSVVPGAEPAAGAVPAPVRADLLTGAVEVPLAELVPVGRGAGATLDGVEEPTVLRAAPAGELPAWVAGAVGVRTTDGDLRGLAAASCQIPASEVWLVGGGTSLGSGARLVVANPGRTPATVTVRLWGPTGPVELAGAPQYLVPPGQERVVLLEGVAAEQERVVVQLTAAGGLVSAYLQDSALRGLVPAGVDHVVAGTGPATEQVVAGVSVTASAADAVDVALLRLLAPGEEAGTAEVTVLGPEGAVELPGAERVRLTAGAVVDVPLGGLPAGSYTLVVRADVDVVAGAMLTSGQGAGRSPSEAVSDVQDLPLDRAWLPAVRPGGSGALALPPGMDGLVVVSAVPVQGAQGAATAVLDAVGVGGVLGSTTLRIADGTTASLPLGSLDGASAGATGLVLRSDDPRLAWTVVLTEARPEGDLVAVVSPVPPLAERPGIAVRVR